MGSEPDHRDDSVPADAPRDEGLARAATEDGDVTSESPQENQPSMAPSGEVKPRASHEEQQATEPEQEQEDDASEPEDDEDVESLIEIETEEENLDFHWYILKVQVNREESIRDALLRRVKIHGLEPMFGELVVPTEDVAEYNKAGKRRIVKKKLYPGYIMVNMAINDDSWFLVRETPGIGDFTGSAGKPTPMDPADAERIISRGKKDGGEEGQVKTSIPFKSGDQVRVKDGNFQGFEGDVESIDEAHGRVTVMINIFGRPTPVELEHWQIESV